MGRGHKIKKYKHRVVDLLFLEDGFFKIVAFNRRRRSHAALSLSPASSRCA
jgi:hypothetical protein